jgi:uncharacterized radical SAM superfamily Fe-S cluster-containing enzyme
MAECENGAREAQEAEREAQEREAQEYDRLQQALLERIETFTQEENLGNTQIVELLITAAVRLRMATYAMFAEELSAAGIKFDLDRLRHDVEEIVRGAKNGAEAYIELVKQSRAQEEAG